MRRFRQWLAAQQDHMTESPDGGWAIYTEALTDKEAAVHEWQDIAGQWEDKCQKLTEQIAALQRETSRLYAVTVEQSKQIATLNDALSGRDGIIERLKGYLANKKTDIAEKVEYINSLTAENRRLEEEMVKLKEEFISRREWRFVDATPNGDLPVRILAAYIEDVFTTDNTVGIPPNPLCKLMNETQEKRNIILRKAIDALKGKEAGG